MSRGQYTISHRLFVFFTQELGTCYQFHRGYENGKIRVNLQIYGTFMLNFFLFSLLTFFFTGDELHNKTAIINTFEDAKDACLRKYISFLFREEKMTWYVFFYSYLLLLALVCS
jgi:hypothetical protein